MTEEATKTSLVLPFFDALGFNVFDHTEFCAGYTIKGEKIDYAILREAKPNRPFAIIKTRHAGAELQTSVAQMRRYFAMTPSRIAIITNGIEYWFFTDVKSNKDTRDKSGIVRGKDNPTKTMDVEPYLKINLTKLTEMDWTLINNYSRDNIETALDKSIENRLSYERVCRNFLSEIVDGSPPKFLLTKLMVDANSQLPISDAADILKEVMGEFVEMPSIPILDENLIEERIVMTLPDVSYGIEVSSEYFEPDLDIRAKVDTPPIVFDDDTELDIWGSL